MFDGAASATANNWSAVVGKSPYSKVDTLRVDTLIRPKTPWWKWTTDSIYGRYDFEMYAYAVSDYETAEEAYETVLDTAGCFPRDHVELRLVNDTRNKQATYSGASRGNGIIDTEEDAEGFYDYTVVAPLIDTDQDGMPDEWESANGCDPTTPDNNVRHASGYTMLEMYLDYAMTHKEPMDDGYQEPQGLEEVMGYGLWVTGKKILRGGQIFIQRGANTYTLEGQIIEAGK